MDVIKAHLNSDGGQFYRRRAIYTGMGIGEHYIGAGWIRPNLAIFHDSGRVDGTSGPQSLEPR